MGSQSLDKWRGGNKMVLPLEPKTLSPEEDEEQIIMRRLRNSVDELKRGYRWLDYRMQKVKDKADRAMEQRESIELKEEMISTRGEPIAWAAPTRKSVKTSIVYKGCRLNNRLLNNFRPTIGQFVVTYGLCYATKFA